MTHDHATSLLRDNLHWLRLRVRERITFKLWVYWMYWHRHL